MAAATQQNATPNGPKPRALRGFQHINRYWDNMHQTYAAKILPGEYYVTNNSELIVTVLGSCVSACIRDTVFGIGGMNHFMLPMENNCSSIAWKTADSAAARYGNVAMELLINDILKNGGNRKNLEIKITGGGKILAKMTDIGRNNVAFVRDYIATENLQLASAEVGDIYPRKVYYNPKTGKVRVKKLRSLHNNTVIERETEYMSKLDSEPVEGSIDLF